MDSDGALLSGSLESERETVIGIKSYALGIAGGPDVSSYADLPLARLVGRTDIASEWSRVTVGHDLIERMGCYVEFFTVTSSAPGFNWQGQVDIGLTCAMKANAQLDLGCNFGVTKFAPDYQPFIGIAYRY